MDSGSPKICSECGVEKIDLDGQLQCPTASCPASPVTTLAVRRPPSVPYGYMLQPAQQHPLPLSDSQPGITGAGGKQS